MGTAARSPYTALLDPPDTLNHLSSLLQAKPARGLSRPLIWTLTFGPYCPLRGLAFPFPFTISANLFYKYHHVTQGRNYCYRGVSGSTYS